MTTLEITPKWADKTARFKGTVAAGESVSVTVKGAAEWTAGGGLRLRVVGLRGETLAQFPPEVEIEDESATPDLWGADGEDATCTLNLRTDAMMRAVPPGATMPFLFVLDDVTDDGETLYFKDLCEVVHWPQRTGEDNPPPYAMRGYRDFVKDVLNRVNAVETQIGNLTLRAQRFTEMDGDMERYGVEITVWGGAEGTVPAKVKLYDGEVSFTHLNAAIAAAVARMADKTAFENHAGNTTMHITAADRSTWNAKYAKPSGGIPKSDLAAAVQTSLGRADTALQAHQDISGKADLVGGKVPQSQLPSYVDDVLEYAAAANFPATGEEGKIYVAKDTNKTYRWSGTGYVQVGGSDIIVDSALSTTSENPVQNKVVTAALDARPTKAQIDAGWWSEWTVKCDGVDVTSQVPQPTRYVSDSGWAVPDEYPASFLGVALDDINTGYDKNTSVMEWIASTGEWVATRHRVAAPVPTKTSELTNDSGFLTEHQRLTPVYSQNPTFSGWVCEPAEYQGHQIEFGLVYTEGAWFAVIKAGAVESRFPFTQDVDAATSQDIVGGVDWTGDVDVTATRTRTDIIGYTLGDQTTKPLQPKGDYLTEHQDISGKADVSAVPLLAAMSAAKLASSWTYSDPGLGDDEIYTEPVWSNGVWTIKITRYSEILKTFVGTVGTYTVQGQPDAAMLTFFVEGENITFQRKSANVTKLAHLSDVPDISGKADKSEMSVTPGIGANADKTTIQLKTGTSAMVLTQHQSLAGLTPMYPFTEVAVAVGEWTFSGTAPQSGYEWSVGFSDEGASGDGEWTLYELLVGSGGGGPVETVSAGESATSLTFSTAGVAATRGRVVTAAPYTVATYTATSTAEAFEIAVGALPTGVTGTARDCILVIDCTAAGAVAPTVTWGTHFHPRTDAGTDFACEAGVRNVYYISEYAPGEFAVGGWQETVGGYAPSNGGSGT